MFCRCGTSEEGQISVHLLQCNVGRFALSGSLVLVTLAALSRRVRLDAVLSKRSFELGVTATLLEHHSGIPAILMLTLTLNSDG